ncbi:zinc finger BED domain-containing protein 4-like [Acyrthosiphon pisum]|uniref:HAT C-terminal dimerisation domain-containing protein n=1 Tax=Acyrthosiphon pisum TaxID=7029 RepID=A0A8R2B8R4_ACYPI|nr:zinc finger BED domain-containing protein 4-like [Acyrthosiphon pisum]|eukprot:XP_008187161.1 PREDICTED: zinc finger BED domain-containing protein 4-like [Acyrthosiphon pisum]
MLNKKLYNITCTTKEANHLLGQLKIEFYKRFHDAEKIRLLAISTILDPRFKRIHFEGPLNAANAVGFIREEIKSKNNHPDNSNQRETEVTSNIRPKVTQESLWEDHDLQVSQQCLSTTDDSTYLSAIKLYLQSNVEDRTSSSVIFWENTHYKCLSNLGLKYSCILASSVPSERLFSSAGNILTDCRSRLLSKRFEQLTFL